ncbi:hypothetical protein NA56DRAFT_34413 [Hyaloscypha hepaticicola]|uniref:Uncharacterized protein n=1 Tax=Hyaloscypha hepaticicola TaxID=2082293 RepID=A0A2J6QDJ1_9HELO|nr:hypothetical protein NA56DRAFT_34413 [Hyaloscypha hepaticicola]
MLFPYACNALASSRLGFLPIQNANPSNILAFHPFPTPYPIYPIHTQTQTQTQTQTRDQAF